MNLKIKIFIGVFVLIIIGLCAGMYLFNKKVPGLEETKADFSMTADELFDAFDINENEALTKYENKVIAVTGKVAGVKNNDNKSNIILEAENALVGGINCSFNNLPEGVKNGDMITVKGRCQGFLMDVVLNNCVKE